MILGTVDADSFWFPALGDAFGLKPWDMERVRLDHFQQMLKYLAPKKKR